MEERVKITDSLLRWVKDSERVDVLGFSLWWVGPRCRTLGGNISTVVSGQVSRRTDFSGRWLKWSGVSGRSSKSTRVSCPALGRVSLLHCRWRRTGTSDGKLGRSWVQSYLSFPDQGTFLCTLLTLYTGTKILLSVVVFLCF